MGPMARRIEIELTSSRDDGTWTWRAAGAKEPKGVVDANVIPGGAKVGDVLRVDAEFEIEGISIINVLPSKEKQKEPETIKLLGPARPRPQGVTTQLVGKGDRPRRGRDGDRKERGDRPPRGDRPERRERPARAKTERPAPEPKPKPRKLSPANIHRAGAVAALSPEQQPVAEQLLRGGIPAVRQAIEAQNKAAKEAGQPEVNAEKLLAIAEELLPQLKAAEWLDRAEAAAQHADEIGIRDLRSVVATADAASRDDRGRELATTLKGALDRRVTAERERWLGDMTSALEEGRLVRALRIAARTPDPGVRVPAETATRLSEAASVAMAPEASTERWTTLLEAVAASPVRRSVKPVGLPPEPSAELLEAARKAAGRIPALAPMLGIPMPPPPGPAKAAPTRRPPKPKPAASAPPPVPTTPPSPPAPPAPAAAEPAATPIPAEG